MSRTSRISSSLSSSGSFIEERSKTFVVPPRQIESADGASACHMPIGHDFETVVNLVNSKFNKKERQLKAEMIQEFQRRLDRDKRHNEEIIATLRRDISQLIKISQECEGLKELQKAMQQEITLQHEKIMTLREENAQLRTGMANTNAMIAELETLREENQTLKRENVLLEIRAVKLKSTVTEKEQEIVGMKNLIDTQYKRIKLDLTNTRDRFHNDQETIHNDMKQQQLMLSEISAAVKTISGEIGENVKKKTVAGKRVLISSELGKCSKKDSRVDVNSANGSQIDDSGQYPAAVKIISNEMGESVKKRSVAAKRLLISSDLGKGSKKDSVGDVKTANSSETGDSGKKNTVGGRTSVGISGEMRVSGKKKTVADRTSLSRKKVPNEGMIVSDSSINDIAGHTSKKQK